MSSEFKNPSKVIPALARLQKRLKAPKGQVNSFGGYKYRSCEDILEAVKKVIDENHVIIINDDMTVIGDRVYVKATASFMHGDDCISVSAFAREPLTKKGMDEPQITGCASSYARKYALNGLLQIDDNKDPDATNFKLMDAIKENEKGIALIKNCLALDDDISAAAEAWCEIDIDTQQTLWIAQKSGGPFSQEEKKAIKSMEFVEACKPFLGDVR